MVDTGTFVINKNSDETYSQVWKLNISSTYTVVTTDTEIVKGSPVNLSNKYYDTAYSWLKLGFSSFKATVDDNGTYTITYTPCVKNTAKLNVGSRTLVVNIGGNKYTHTIPAISETGVTKGNSRSFTMSTSSMNLTVVVYMTYNIKATLSGTYTSSVSLKNGQSIELPSRTINTITTTETIPFIVSVSKLVELLQVSESFRQITLEQTNLDQLVFRITSEYGDFELISPKNIGLLERHKWSVVIGYDTTYTCSLYKDNEVLASKEISSNLLITAIRDLCLVGTDSELKNYYKGNIYNVNIINPSDTLMNFNFIEGSGLKTYDTSSQNRVGELKGTVSWLIENGLIFDGNDGYLELPVFEDDVYFTNGFKIEFEGTLGNLNNLAKLLDLSTVYNNDNAKNNNCSINIGVNGNTLQFNTTSIDYKTYKVTENTIDLSQKHKFMLNCVDNGKTGYDISFVIDGVIMAIDRFNYGGITNIRRTSNFIGRSNTTTDNLFRGILNNFKITIYASSSAIPIYRSALYEFDTTSTDFGKPLYLELKTKGINMKYPQHLKKLKHIFVKVVGGYNYGELFFTLYGDGYIVNDPKTYSYYIDDNGTVVQEYEENKELTIDEKISLLGNMRLDKTKLGEGLYQTRKLVIPRKAKNFAILISGDSSDYISLESIGYVCKLGKVKEN